MSTEHAGVARRAGHAAGRRYARWPRRSSAGVRGSWRRAPAPSRRHGQGGLPSPLSAQGAAPADREAAARSLPDLAHRRGRPPPSGAGHRDHRRATAASARPANRCAPSKLASMSRRPTRAGSIRSTVRSDTSGLNCLKALDSFDSARRHEAADLPSALRPAPSAIGRSR